MDNKRYRFGEVQSTESCGLDMSTLATTDTIRHETLTVQSTYGRNNQHWGFMGSIDRLPGGRWSVSMSIIKRFAIPRGLIKDTAQSWDDVRGIIREHAGKVGMQVE